MPDFGAFSAAASALSQAVTTVQTVKEIAQRLDHAELRLAIADLTGNLADARLELAQATEENAQLRREMEDRRRMADIRTNLVKVDNFYEATEAIPGYGKGPFCMRCLDADGILVNVVVIHHPAFTHHPGCVSPAYDSFKCTNCIIKNKSD